MNAHRTTDPVCPECGGKTDCIEVDIGVGNLQGPRFCLDCGWREPEAPELDLLIDADPDDPCESWAREHADE